MELTDLAEVPPEVLVAVGLCSSFAAWISIKLLSSAFKTRANHKIRDKKKKRLQEINGNWYHQAQSQITADDAERIVKLSFGELRRELLEGEITPTKALHAYQFKVAKENQTINFMCEPIMEAKDTALKLDRMSESERQKLQLFGIPISLKENYFLEGYDCTVGCVKYIDKPMSVTSCIVQALVKQGAIPFIRTNVPQTCMSFDSTNPIYGVTCNPYNKERSCGGSSGGEGAAIGCGASVLGFGSDIGGSVRIPAAWCGIYSLKPTAGRLSLYGDLSADLNERIVTITCGPMGRDVDSLIASMRALSTSESYDVDPYVPPVTFNEATLKSTQKLRIGYLVECDPIDTCSSSKRSVNMAINTLKSQGHELVKWMPPKIEWAISVLFTTNLFADGGEKYLKAIENDQWESHIVETILISKAPTWLKLAMAKVLTPFFPKYQVNYLKSSCGSGTIGQLWQDEADIKTYRREVVRELQQQGIDALIFPAMPVPAMRIGECKDAVGAIAYMGMFNLLNFPAGVVPVTRGTNEDTLNDRQLFSTKDMFHKAMKLNLEGCEGLPMSVQVASLPYREEICLRIMKELETSIGYKV